MKIYIGATFLFLLGCSKSDLSGSLEKRSMSLQQKDSALVPLTCHILSNSSERPSDLTLHKEQYSDTRIKSLNLSTGQFYLYSKKWFLKLAYYPNKAKITGGRGEYYNDRKLRSNQDTIEVNFNKYGYAISVYTISASKVRTLRMNLYYNTSNPALVRLVRINNYPVVNDARGNILSVRTGPKPENSINYTYNSSGSGKKHFYMPATRRVTEELWMDDYYSLLEIMQWIPMPRNARTSHTILDTDSETPFTVPLANHKYDASGNLVSYTFYNDERAPTDPWRQTLIWHCKSLN